MPRIATLDTTQLAKLLMITPRHVRRLTADGVLARARDEDGTELQGRFELVKNVQAFIKYWQEKAKYDDASDSRYAQLRNQRMAAEAEMAETKLKELRGEFLRTADVEFMMTNLITATKQHLLAIPSRVSRLLVGCTSFQKIFDTISGEIRAALTEMSNWTAGMFARQRVEYLTAQGADPTSLDGE
jgi:phage terminase Nu1 subunit (DNA packaging protein)